MLSVDPDRPLTDVEAADLALLERLDEHQPFFRKAPSAGPVEALLLLRRRHWDGEPVGCRFADDVGPFAAVVVLDDGAVQSASQGLERLGDQQLSLVLEKLAKLQEQVEEEQRLRRKVRGDV